MEDSQSIPLSNANLNIIREHLDEFWDIRFQKVTDGTLIANIDSKRRAREFERKWEQYVDGEVCRSYHTIDERELLDKLGISHETGIEVCLNTIARGSKHTFHLYIYETIYFN